MPKTAKTAPTVPFDEPSKKALDACREYLRQAEEFLGGRRKELPDASRIAVARFRRTTLSKGRCTGNDEYGIKQPFIAAQIADRVADKERYFDPWYFNAMLLMYLPGGRFLLARSKNNKFFYLAYVKPGRKTPEHFLRRIIVDAPSGADVRLRKGFDHHDYRRVTLRTISKRKVREKFGQKTRAKSHSRDDAINFAVSLFNDQLDGQDKIPILDLDKDGYERLLRKAFDVADRMHEKLHGDSNLSETA